MENTERYPQSSIPRRSRLPVPRATLTTTGSLRVHQRDIDRVASQISKLPDDPKLTPSKKPPQLDSALQDSHSGNAIALNQSQAPHAAEPVDDGLIDSHADGYGILLPKTPDGFKDKRRPRPSLSERTMETLSQVTPSPSPSRQRTGYADQHNIMAPPYRPTTTLRLSHSNGNLQARQVSPSKQPPQLFSHTTSSTSGVASTSSSQHHSVPTPTRKGSKFSGSSLTQVGKHADQVSSQSEQRVAGIPGSVSSPSRVRSLQSLRESSSKSSIPRSSTATTSCRQLKQISSMGSTGNKENSDHLTAKKPAFPQSSTSSSGLRSNFSSSKPSIATERAKSPVKTKSKDSSLTVSTTAHVPKSSSTLRETIAKAKAAKREMNSKAAVPRSESSAALSFAQQSDFAIGDTLGTGSNKTLQKRIDAAVTSGTLNIAALGLSSLPEEIQHMYDFNQSSTVNWAEAVDLVKFSAADNELTDLPGAFFPDWSEQELQESDDKTNQFGGLQTLDFHGNRLRAVPKGFRRLGQLQTLFLANNQLEVDVLDIVSQMPHLRELHLANNNIEGTISSSLATMTSLEVLDLHSNRILMLPESVSGMINLQRLDLSDNRFNTIPMASLCDLPITELNLSQNSLSGTLFANNVKLPRLQVLNVASNRFTSICDSNLDLPKLHSLTCDNNQLSSLPTLTQFEALVTLNASGNRLEFLPHGFTEAANLHSVDLSGNQIRVLDPRIGQMDKLANLNVAANPLRDRKYLAMRTDHLKAEMVKRLDIDTQESGATSVTESEVSTITRSTDGVPNEHIKPVNGVLDLTSKNLRSIDLDTTDLNQAIHTLILTRNHLVGFPQELLTHPMIKSTLKTLDISHNESLHATNYLTSQVNLPRLESLRIVDTGMHSIAGVLAHLSAPLLKELNISSQRITGPLPYFKQSFSALTTLLVADNCFSSIDAEAIRGLEVVDIRNNDIESLPPKIGELGNLEAKKAAPGRLRALECSGNKFRIPRTTVLERGTEAVLRDLRRMIPIDQLGDEWQE